MYDDFLPIYIVADYSASMTGEPSEALKQGIKALITELKGDPLTSQSAYISFIVYNTIARRLTPLVPVKDFRRPPVMLGGISYLSAAFNVLCKSIKEDLNGKKVNTTTFIFTDGKATGKWEKYAESVKDLTNIIVCLAGANAQPLNGLKNINLNTLSYGEMISLIEVI